ncbi:hypothetical protein CLU79DRAFT_531015 [Phycomyces nitens]|nr:hypothetical protein CLU79DRAFT_531015 [Phycomyces nitens]
MRGTSMSAKTSTHLRPLSKAPLPKMTERERRNEELSELKKALQLSEAKHSQCSVRLAKWKKIALDAERSSLKTTDYENKLKKEYEAQLEELEGRYIERSKEAAETIERLEDTNKKLKKEITLLRMKEKPTAEPARVVQRRATVQTDQLSQTVPPPVHVSRAKSNALVFSINFEPSKMSYDHTVVDRLMKQTLHRVTRTKRLHQASPSCQSQTPSHPPTPHLMYRASAICATSATRQSSHVLTAILATASVAAEHQPHQQHTLGLQDPAP